MFIIYPSSLPYPLLAVIVGVVFAPLCPLCQELEDLRRKYMTKKGPVQKVMGQMRLLSSEDKVRELSYERGLRNVGRGRT